jgi:hypothetical protein
LRTMGSSDVNQQRCGGTCRQGHQGSFMLCDRMMSPS